MTRITAPQCSKLQAEISRGGEFAPVPRRCVVTGGTGFVGQRLVEMLVERGAERVVALDIVPKPANAWDHPNIDWVVGDVSKLSDVLRACEGADCVWHVAAAVGPFHPKEVYERVNHQGTLNVIEACKQHKIHKLVMSSSPSTRFTGEDIDGLREDELPTLPMRSYLQGYAESKANGEIALQRANNPPELMTIAVAPHQVYGPRDNLFLPNLLEAGGTGRLRIFGSGLNRVCMTHVDNYCHGLIIAERALTPDSPALGKFYIVTDGDTHPNPDGHVQFWDLIDDAVVAMGFASVKQKMHLNKHFLMLIAYICAGLGALLGMKFKLSPFSVRMCTMHRWFRIDNAARDLHYKPIVRFKEGWEDTKTWFRANWLPSFNDKQGLTGISKSTQAKIDIQSKKTN